jgi:hypothetical protein
MLGEQPIGGPKFGKPRRIDPQADTRNSWSQGVPLIDRVDLQDLPLVYAPLNALQHPRVGDEVGFDVVDLNLKFDRRRQFDHGAVTVDVNDRG